MCENIYIFSQTFDWEQDYFFLTLVLLDYQLLKNNRTLGIEKMNLEEFILLTYHPKLI